MSKISRIFGAVWPQYSPLSSSAFRSMKTSFFNTPWARRKRKSKRAKVVFPVPGLPVTTTFKHVSNNLGLPPRRTNCARFCKRRKYSFGSLMPTRSSSSRCNSCRSFSASSSRDVWRPKSAASKRWQDSGLSPASMSRPVMRSTACSTKHTANEAFCLATSLRCSSSMSRASRGTKPSSSVSPNRSCAARATMSANSSEV
mmetsp:Transcript_37304/g.79229  ORF Transcript_37304/g.79229 Transcript_37304/m.79229 type:complete len:200 (-) Transcript_37304:1850-2449(-)